MRRLLVLAGVVLVALAGAAWLIGRSGETGRVDGGPLACTDCSRGSSGIPTLLNQPASFGLLYLQNRGSKPAIVERVYLVERSPGMELHRALVSRPRGIGLLNGNPEPDPDNPLRPVRGFVVPPYETSETVFQVILVLRLTRYGRGWFRHVAVDYRVGERAYRAVFNESVSLCAARAGRPRSCRRVPLW